MSKVNLDALIPREDFELKDEATQDTAENTDKIGAMLFLVETPQDSPVIFS